VSARSGAAERWRGALVELCERVRAAAREALAAARDEAARRALAAPVGQGAGDVTFGLDRVAERAIERWSDEARALGPFSLLTEETGWTHHGAPGFGHGGPRVVVDPIDGTRNLMADLRGAWTVVALAGPGAGEPRQSEVELGILSEIPDSRAARFRRLSGGPRVPARCEEHALAGGAAPLERALAVDGEARCDHGYFPFFRYAPWQRPALARVEADFFARLARAEGADVSTCWDDQYISNGGQLALLALGTYRMIADLRALVPAGGAPPRTTTKPYDVAGALAVARAAGAPVEAPDGSPLDFPLDATTPLSFVGWANEATRARLAPHLAAALRATTP
jgi:fructose-1,6-bisphosphatase/inositol monophosphatase family enzyme